MSWEITVNEKNFYRRLDKFLRNALSEIPLSAIYKFIRKGKVYVNGKRIKDNSFNLSLGDTVSIKYVDIDKFKIRKKNSIEPQRLELNILYEDGDILVLNKPAGLALHPGKNVHVVTLIEGLLYYAKDRDFEPHLVHRLDLNTSGTLVVAKSKETARILTEYFKGRKIRKIYLTLVHGKIKEECGIIDEPIDGLDAETQYRVLNGNDRYTLLEVEIKTGRKHQIRRHFSSIGHPVVGDNKYGLKKLNKEIKRLTGLKRQFLHCKSLIFVHPRNKRKMRFDSPLPEDLKKTLNILGLGR